MKHCNYEKLKPKLIKAGMSHIRNESKEEIAYVQDMFETIFKDYTKEKDVHISGLLADLMNQTPVTAENFQQLKGKILLILPDQDFFSGQMQEDLIRLMHDPENCICFRRSSVYDFEVGGLRAYNPRFSENL